MKPQRLPQLDYLRGLVALGICFYHLTIWKTNQELPASSLLGKLGIYGVTIFYLLSGYTLALVYQKVDFWDKTQLRTFFIKRFFRIYPLLWVATIGTLFVIQPASPIKIFLNLSGLFSLFSWDKYIATGAWSIGNELFFYSVFPFLMWLRTNYKHFFVLTGVVLFAVLVYQSFYQLTPKSSLASQWSIYICPFSQLFFFYLGIAIQLIKFEQKPSFGVVSLALLAVLFYLTPVYGNQIMLVTSWLRILFVLVCTYFVFVLAHIVPKTSNGIVHYVLNWLGEISYSVYLLHPICFKLWPSMLKMADSSLKYFWETLVIFILLSSTLMYHVFEKSFIRLGYYVSKHK